MYISKTVTKDREQQRKSVLTFYINSTSNILKRDDFGILN